MLTSTFRSAWFQLGVATAVVVVAVAIMVSFAVADNSVVQPLSGGTRSAGIDDVSLGALGYSHEAQVNTGTMSLTVDDSSATGEGWNVTIQSSNLGYTGLHNGDPIDAANLVITSANSPSVSAGQTIDGSNGPQVPASNSTGSLDVARKVLHANAGYGQGTYNQTLDFELLVPGMSRAGDYTGSLTVTISAAP